MPTHKAEAEWKGNLAEGSGRLKFGSSAFDGPYSFNSRFVCKDDARAREQINGSAVTIAGDKPALVDWPYLQVE
jgi:hypothetical protein